MNWTPKIGGRVTLAGQPPVMAVIALTQTPEGTAGATCEWISPKTFKAERGTFAVTSLRPFTRPRPIRVRR